MMQRITLILLFFCLFTIKSQAQTQFWSDNFEDTGAPSSGARTPSIAEFSCSSPATSYFFRTGLANVALQSGTYTGFEGTKFFAAEDIDRGPTCTNASISANQQVIWSSINIAGKSGLSFKGLFACNNFNGSYQGTDWGTAQDFMAIEYRIDGGTWTKAIGIYSSLANSSNIFSVDNNGDLLGDGTALSYAFTELTASIVGTGTTLDLRFNCHVNATGSQEIAADNFRLFSYLPPPVLSGSQTNVSCNGGSNGSATVSASGGTPPYSYSWAPSGGSGATATALASITYTCTVTDAANATATKTFNITQPSAITTTAISQTNISCFGGSNGSATVSASGGSPSYSYSWSPSGGTGATATGLSAGSYTCTVSDANSCVATKTFVCTQSSALVVTPSSQTNISCFGGSNGAASINAASGGTGGYTYNWTPGNPTGDGTVSVTGLTAGSYTCTVTDANACVATKSFTCTQTPALVVTPASQTNISCNGGSNGAASINNATGGAGGYTYNWTPGNPTGDGTVSVTGLTAGTWTLVVTDQNSCTQTQIFNITQPSAISATPASQTNISCFGGSNGAATVIANGGTPGYTYSWSPSGGTGATATGLSAGSYTCSVTDANSCVATRVFTCTQTPALIATAASQTNISCFGGSNGAASINAASGGAGGYSYDWTPGTPTGDGTISVTGLTAGTWTCTVTDLNACAATQSFNITEPSVLVVTPASQTNISCNGANNGAASVNATGGTPGYTYNWIPSGGTGATATGLSAGNYTCTVTDANSCNAFQTFNIIEPNAIPVTNITQSICQGDSYSFNGNTLTIAGNYNDTLVNVAGCDSVISLSLTLLTTPAPTVTADSICMPGGIVNLSATGYNVQWFDQLVGGNLLNSGNTYSPNIVADSTYYVSQEGFTGSTNSITMPPQTIAPTGNARGYYFTAPSNFTITSLQVPTSASSGAQSIAVLKFNGNTPPPIFSSTTNAFTTLFLTQGDLTPGNISVNIPIVAGDVIGIFGVRDNVNSYANTGSTITIDGNPVSLTRMGMQYPLSSNNPQDVWSESFGSISRVNFEYSTIAANGCFSSPRTPIVAKVNPLPFISSVNATPAAICAGDSSLLTALPQSVDTLWSNINAQNAPQFNFNGAIGYNKIVVNSTMNVDKLFIDIAMASTPSTQLNLGLYTDLAGHANNLIVQSVPQSNIVAGQVIFPIPNTILTPGTYWIAFGQTYEIHIKVDFYTPGNFYEETYINTVALPSFAGSLPPTSYSGVSVAIGLMTSLPIAQTYTWSTPATVANANVNSTMAFPSVTTNYTVTATSASGCTTTSTLLVVNNNTGILAQATAGNLLSTTGNANQIHTQNDGSSHTYSDGSCNVIATVNDGLGGNVLGSTISTVVVDATVQTFNSQPYVRRHYTITPTNQGAATVTLYLTQADFDDYNANNGTFLDLPTSSADLNAIGNVRITQVHGAGVLGVDVAEVISPLLTWDGINNYWTATFPVDSFSSFYFHTVNPLNSALPITLLSFTGNKEGTVNRLNWITATEQNNAYFNVQRSIDGRDFTAIGKVNTKAINGNSTTLLQYDLQDENPKTGHNYYRLQQVDKDGRKTESNVIDLFRSLQGGVVNVYPNPTTSVVNIDLTANSEDKISIKLSDLSGRVLKALDTKTTQGINTISLDMNGISAGLYMLQVIQNNEIMATQKVEKK